LEKNGEKNTTEKEKAKIKKNKLKKEN